MLRRAVLLLVCLLGAVVSSPVPDNAKVLRLDANSFHASVASRRFVAVAFIAPWCAHCKRLEPEWQAAVRALAASGMRDITLATLDTTADQENAAVAKQHDVRGFPDIRIFRHGDCSPGASETYKGPRTAAGVVTAMTRLFREKARVLKTADEALVFVNSSPVAVLGVFAEIDVDENKYENDDDEASRRAFDKAARHFAFDADSEDGEYDVPFGVVFDRSLVPTQDFDEELKNDGAEHGDVFVYRDFAKDTRAVRLRRVGEKVPPKMTSAELVPFVTRHATPSVATLNRNPRNVNTLRRVFREPGPKVLMFADDVLVGQTLADAARAFLASNEGVLASSGKDSVDGDTSNAIGKEPADMRFVLGAVSENANALRFFHVDSKRTPAVVIHDTKSDARYVLHDVTDALVFTKWLEEFHSGELTPTLRSAGETKETETTATAKDTSKNAKPAAATILVAKGFQNSLSGAESPSVTLVMFHAPWCGHCAAFKPVYDDVAYAFSGDDTVAVVAFDAAANDVPDPRFSVKGFPAVRLYRKADDTVITFEGKRTVDDLVEFVKKHRGVFAREGDSKRGGDGEL